MEQDAKLMLDLKHMDASLNRILYSSTRACLNASLDGVRFMGIENEPARGTVIDPHETDRLWKIYNRNSSMPPRSNFFGSMWDNFETSKFGELVNKTEYDEFDCRRLEVITNNLKEILERFLIATTLNPILCFKKPEPNFHLFTTEMILQCRLFTAKLCLYTLQVDLIPGTYFSLEHFTRADTAAGSNIIQFKGHTFPAEIGKDRFTIKACFDILLHMRQLIIENMTYTLNHVSEKIRPLTHPTLPDDMWEHICDHVDDIERNDSVKFVARIDDELEHLYLTGIAR